MNGKTIVLFLLGVMVTGCASTNNPAPTDTFFYKQLFLLNDVATDNGAAEQPRLVVRPLPLTIRRPVSSPARAPAEPAPVAVAQTEPVSGSMAVAEKRPLRPVHLLAFGDYPHGTLKPEHHPPLTDQELTYIHRQLAQLQQTGENTDKYLHEIHRGETEGGVMAWFYRRWVPY